MEWLLVLLAGGGVAAVARKVSARRSEQTDQREELEGVRRLAEEDVVVFGEQLQRLDGSVGVTELDEDTRVDYQRALDAYESVQRTVRDLRDAEQVSQVTDTLSTGRYALACVQARLEDRPLPELRTPCFFNPQHGPSVTDVVWTSPRWGTRSVPACAQDAARVAARERPEVRTVEIGARRVPYWEAGASFLPYSKGYFPAGTHGAGWVPGAGDAGGHGGWDGGASGGISHTYGGDVGGDAGDGGSY